MNLVRPKVVFDCLIFLQAAARKDSPAGECLNLFDLDHIELFISSPVLSEINDVLRRPKLRQKFSALTPEFVDALLDNLRSRARLILDVPDIFKYPRDPKDEPYLNLAIASGSDYLVSFDKDLLDLADESTKDGAEFKQMCPGLTILDPHSFLSKLSLIRSETNKTQSEP